MSSTDPAARGFASSARLACITGLALVTGNASAGPAAYAQEPVQSVGSVAEAAAPDDRRAAEPAGRRIAGLFDAEEPLELVLKADLKTLLKDRDTTERTYRPATLTYVDAGGRHVSQDVKVRTRGIFRLARQNCAFPPLRLKFSKRRWANTVFANENGLKLVTHCQKGKDYEQYVLQEYLAYKVYNLLTSRSFRVRLARITYVDAAGKTEPVTKPAFFLEDEDRMAERHGAKIIDIKGADPSDVDAGEFGVLSVFQYLIGNTDWSLPGLHNIKLTRTPNHTVFAIPFDFDWAGVIATRYATPAPQLRIRSVRDRLYRGDCRSAEQFAPIFAKFNERRDAIYALYRNLPGLEPRHVERTHEYFDAFYKTINDPRAVQREFVESCLER